MTVRCLPRHNIYKMCCCSHWSLIGPSWPSSRYLVLDAYQCCKYKTSMHWKPQVVMIPTLLSWRQSWHHDNSWFAEYEFTIWDVRLCPQQPNINYSTTIKIWIKIKKNSVNKMHLKMPSAKHLPFHSSPNELKCIFSPRFVILHIYNDLDVVCSLITVVDCQTFNIFISDEGII